MNLIEAAVAPVKADAMNDAETRVRERIATIFATLEAAGWDAEIVAPYPSMNNSREFIRKAQGLRQLVHRITKSTSSSLRFGQPDIRVAYPEGVEKIVAEVREQAGVQYDAFVAKLVAKVGEGVTGAKLDGNHVWGHSILTVTKGETVERWKTQRILNHSPLGLPFNQWPTRKIK